QLHVVREDVSAERLAGELRLRELVDRLTESLGERDDPARLAVLGRELVEVLLHGLRKLVALLDPLEPRMQERREGEVGVARRVWAPDLGTSRLLVPGLVERDADQR